MITSKIPYSISLSSFSIVLSRNFMTIHHWKDKQRCNLAYWFANISDIGPSNFGSCKLSEIQERRRSTAGVTREGYAIRHLALYVEFRSIPWIEIAPDFRKTFELLATSHHLVSVTRGWTWFASRFDSSVTISTPVGGDLH